MAPSPKIARMGAELGPVMDQVTAPVTALATRIVPTRTWAQTLDSVRHRATACDVDAATAADRAQATAPAGERPPTYWVSTARAAERRTAAVPERVTAPAGKTTP